MEVGHAELRVASVLGRNPRPECRGNQVGVLVQMDHAVVAAMHIVANGQHPPVVQCLDVEKLIELVIAGHDDDLTIVLRCPVPEGMRGVGLVVAQVADVASEHKHLTHHFDGVLEEVIPIPLIFQMQV